MNQPQSLGKVVLVLALSSIGLVSALPLCWWIGGLALKAIEWVQAL
jgi:hypothetical protein